MRRLLFSLLILAFLWGAAPARAQDGPTEYTVQPGDTLFLIAQRFDVPMALLARANDITDPT